MQQPKNSRKPMVTYSVEEEESRTIGGSMAAKAVQGADIAAIRA